MSQNPNKEYFVVEGLGGERKLRGKIAVNGAKNAALPLMASAFLFDGPITLSNVPDIEDVKRMAELIKDLGGKLTKKGKKVLTIDASGAKKTILTREISKRLRASIMLTGPVLARSGEVSFPFPGGCVIGARPIDLFVSSFQKMGSSYSENDGMFCFKRKGARLKAAEITFKIQSVTATETLLMAAILSEGKTILRNVALEPEVTALADFLKMSGAKISGIGTPDLVIEGGEMLKAPAEAVEVIPDRIEAGSFLILGALSAKKLKIENCQPEHLSSVIEVLKEAGADIETGENWLIVKGPAKEKFSCNSISVKTHEYPGFPTDLQAPITIFMTQACGEGTVFETIFDGRLNYSDDIVKMGADIKMWDAHHVTVKGPTLLKGRDLESPDIRAGLAFLIAAIVAEGQSAIHNAYFIDRGYEKIERRLRKIGVNIKRASVS